MGRGRTKTDIDGNYNEECVAYKDGWIDERAIRPGFACQ